MRAGEVVEIDKDNPFVKLIKEMLEVIQAKFVTGLKDDKGKQLSRECCCRGLAACFGFSKVAGGSVEVSSSLLKAFGQTTNHGGSAMMETREQEAMRRVQNAETEAEGREGESERGPKRGAEEACVLDNLASLLQTFCARI